MLAPGTFDCAAVLTSSSKNSRHLSSPLGTKLTAVRANQALARYILFSRQQYNEVRRGYSMKKTFARGLVTSFFSF
jgi:hypothetical protein